MLQKPAYLYHISQPSPHLSSVEYTISILSKFFKHLHSNFIIIHTLILILVPGTVDSILPVKSLV